jgi:hypothetical protein
MKRTVCPLSPLNTLQVISILVVIPYNDGAPYDTDNKRVCEKCR